MLKISEGLREKLRDLWHHRPIIVTFVNFENQALGGYCDGFMAGLDREPLATPSNVVAITTRRTTSTGVTLRSVAGGAA